MINYSNHTKNICYKNILNDYKNIIFAGRTTLNFVETLNIQTICDYNRLLYYLYHKNNLLNNEIENNIMYIVVDSKKSVEKLIDNKKNSGTKFSVYPNLDYSYEKNTIYNIKFHSNYEINNSIVNNLFSDNLYIFKKYKNLYNITTDIFIKKLIRIICFLRYRIENRLYSIENNIIT